MPSKLSPVLAFGALSLTLQALTPGAAFADQYTSTAGQTRTTDSTTTTTSLSGTVPVEAGRTVDQAALQNYYNSIWTTIRKAWWVPDELFFKQVKVKMVIEKDGKLSSATLANSSGDGRADTLALIAIKRAAPFAPLPEGLPAPFTVNYTIGFASNKDRDFVIFNGSRYGKGESYTLPTGTRVGHSDRQLSDLDKQFHVKKEAALTRMNKLYDAIGEENKKPAPTIKKANLLTEYADCLVTIQEQAEARGKLEEALAIFDQNQAQPGESLPCLSRLSQLDYSIGDLKAAEPLFKRAIEAREKEAPSPGRNSDLKALMETYAKLLYKQNRAPEADEMYKKIKALNG